MDKTYAVIDIGSNAVRLLIAAVGADGKQIPKSFVRLPLSLGAVAFAGRRTLIPAAKIDRLCEAIGGMRFLMAAMEVDAWRVVATMAVRKAENRGDILNAVKKATELDVQVLDGGEEAAIIGRHAAACFDAAATVLNIDVGGGSTDCALYRKNQQQAVGSFDIGVARQDGGHQTEKDKMREWLVGLSLPPEAIISASGGSAHSLEQAVGQLTAARLAECKDKFSALSPGGIMDEYNLSYDHAVHSAIALDIYLLILSATPVSHLRAIRGGLAQGLITELAATE